MIIKSLRNTIRIFRWNARPIFLLIFSLFLELVLLTADSRLIAIEGLSLCVALRAACVYISTGERTAKELSSVLQLNAQQFNLYNINGVNDVLSTGITQVCAFDQYIGAFMAGGRSVCWIFKNFISAISGLVNESYEPL